MSWTERRSEYERLAHSISDVIVLTTKDAWPWKVIAYGLAIFSLWRFPPRRFLEDFATTIGPIQAYGRAWPRLDRRTVVHEGRHTLQFLFFGWFVPVLGWLHRRVRVWCGLLLMGLLYVLIPLPIGLAYGRYRLELDADAYSWRRALEEGWLDADGVRRRAREFAETVSSAAYLWAWPRPWAVRGFARRAEREIARW